MKRSIIVLFLMLLSISAYAVDTVSNRETEFKSKIQNIDNSIDSLKKSNTELQTTIADQKKNMEDLRKSQKQNESLIQQTTDSLNKTISALRDIQNETQNKIHIIDQTITQRTLYWIMAILVVMLLGLAIFFFLRKKITSNENKLEEQLRKTKEALDTEAIRLDTKLIDLLEKQMTFERQEHFNSHHEKEIDHSLPIKVGEEIYRMRKRISRMSEDTKGLEALKSSLRRLEEEFNSNGYEIIDLIGKSFIDGLTVQARFVSSDNLKPGERVITNVIKPQINFNNILIRAADVEVSLGE